MSKLKTKTILGVQDTTNQKVYLSTTGSVQKGKDLFISVNNSLTGAYINVVELQAALDELFDKGQVDDSPEASILIDSVRAGRGDSNRGSMTITGRLWTRDIEVLGRTPTIDDVLILKGFDKEDA